MSDANKTELTKRVTNAAVLWLSERGFRPIESECTLADGWCADLASFAYITRTEAKRLNLLPDSPKWTPNDFTGWRAKMDAWIKQYEQIPAPITATVEVKTSVNDFRRDKKFDRESPTHFMYLAMPRGLIDLAKVNARWGVLAFDAKDGKVKRVRRPQFQKSTTEQALRVLAEIAMRRDNHTRYERFREFDRQAREHNNERVNAARVSNAVTAVLKIQSGEMGVDEALRYCGIRCKLSKWLREQLESIAPPASDVRSSQKIADAV